MKFLLLKQNRLPLFTICFFLLLAVLGPLLSPFPPEQTFTDSLKLPPLGFEGSDVRFILGTDDLGRDQVSRLIEGARLSLLSGFTVAVLALVGGVLLGSLAGYFGGWIDVVIMRLMDALLALPSILLAVVIVTILGPSLANAVLAAALTAVPGLVRVLRATVLEEKLKNYVIASRLFGASHTRVILLEVLPNCLAPILVQLTLAFGDGILNVAALGFLGLGARPPAAEWGTMLADAKSFIDSAAWLVWLPGLCILMVILAINSLGDHLRDYFDPKRGEA